MSKQTAVDWIIERLGHYGYAGVLDAEDIEQAKDLEKQQIVNAYHSGIMQCDEADLYYKEMYGGDQ
jgi:hypothetical protein